MQKLPAFLFIAFLIPSIALAQGRWEEPWTAGDTSRPGDDSRPSTAGQTIAQGAVRFYQKYISAVDGDRCPSYPTCSQYAIQAMRKHGALIGSIMAFDRLIHEADEVYRAPLVRIEERNRYFDPVENNDFWWKSRGTGTVPIEYGRKP